MKKYLLLAVVTLFAATATRAQGYLGIGTGTCLNTWIVNLQGGYVGKHFALELEMKAAPISQQVNQPAVFAAKAGYPIRFAEGWLLLPYIQYGYQYYSADITKGATWQNGFKQGVGARLQYNHIFVQADHFDKNYFCLGVTKTLSRR